MCPDACKILHEYHRQPNQRHLQCIHHELVDHPRHSIGSIEFSTSFLKLTKVHPSKVVHENQAPWNLLGVLSILDEPLEIVWSIWNVMYRNLHRLQNWNEGEMRFKRVEIMENSILKNKIKAISVKAISANWLSIQIRLQLSLSSGIKHFALVNTRIDQKLFGREVSIKFNWKLQAFVSLSHHQSTKFMTLTKDSSCSLPKLSIKVVSKKVPQFFVFAWF